MYVFVVRLSLGRYLWSRGSSMAAMLGSGRPPVATILASDDLGTDWGTISGITGCLHLVLQFSIPGRALSNL